MRWEHKGNPTPKPNTMRRVRRFLFLPKCLPFVDSRESYQWRWLETAVFYQQYQSDDHQGMYKWEDRYWS